MTDLKVENIAFGGKGVARCSGKVVFVPFTIDGEWVQARIVREKKRFAEGELVEIRESSPYRVTPPCPYFGRCGGCAYQHIEYEHQLALKWRQVREVLQRIGHISDPPMRPIVPSPQNYGYRNRITVHAQDGVIGFYRRESNKLIDIEQCPISSNEVNRALRELRGRSPGDGHFSLRPTAEPRIFYQTNDAVADTLRQLVIGKIPPDQHLLIDAYCGAGFFAKALTGKFQRILGIDWDRFAIEEAIRNATPQETYVAGDVAEQLSRSAAPLVAELNKMSGDRRWLSMIVDPPADGLTDAVRRAILDLAPTTLLYVSCNPTTLARDLNNLSQRFAIQSVTPLDMFPQTAEIEVLVHLQA